MFNFLENNLAILKIQLTIMISRYLLFVSAQISISGLTIIIRPVVDHRLDIGIIIPYTFQSVQAHYVFDNKCSCLSLVFLL